MEQLRYKRGRFSAQFPTELRYSASHYWMSEIGAGTGIWHVGFTRFATRMLGELVEADFDVAAGAPIEVGMQIGWVEGFKAASDVYSVVKGSFRGMNPALAEDACIIRSSPYSEGYLYAAAGETESSALDAQAYIRHLDALIAQMEKDPKYLE